MPDEDILKSGSVDLIGLGVLMVNRSLISFFNSKIRKSGLTIQQMYSLYAICENRGKSITYISKQLCLHQSSFNNMLKRLRNYVDVYKNREDCRYGYPVLNKQGSDILKLWIPKIIAIEKGLGIMIKGRKEFIHFIHRFSSDLIKDKSIPISKEL